MSWTGLIKSRRHSTINDEVLRSNKNIISTSYGSDMKQLLRQLYEKVSTENFLFIYAVGLVMVCLSALLLHDGWPQSHEYISFKYRTEIYAEHFSQGDLFPVWSGSDAYGLGTPLPFFYHKTFYYLGGFLVLVGVPIKASLFLSLFSLMLIGFYGFAWCCKELGFNRLLQVFGASLFISSNYVFTNWLIRGAMAEFAAMMVIPLLLLWCLRCVRGRTINIWIVPLGMLLFFTHSGIAVMFSLVIMSLIACLTYFRPVDIKVRPGRDSVIGLLTVGVCTIFVLITMSFLSTHSPMDITQEGYLPSRNYRPLQDYLWDSSYSWGNWSDLTVRIDGVILLLVGVFIAMAFLKKIKLNREYIFIIGALVLFLYLQTGLSSVVYDVVSPFQVIQFPWRLLAYITPLLIFLGLGALAALPLRRSQQVLVVGGLLGIHLAFSAVAAPLEAFTSSNDLSSRAYKTTEYSLEKKLLGIGEYLPVFTTSPGRVSALRQRYDWYENNKESFSENSGCKITSSTENHEDLIEILWLECIDRGEVKLPINYSKLLRIYSYDGSKKIRSLITASEADPRAIIGIKKGMNTVEIHKPTVLSLLKP